MFIFMYGSIRQTLSKFFAKNVEPNTDKKFNLFIFYLYIFKNKYREIISAETTNLPSTVQKIMNFFFFSWHGSKLNELKIYWAHVNAKNGYCGAFGICCIQSFYLFFFLKA